MTDLIVIGGGVAGMTAALYALRQGRSVTLFECNGIGGQISNSPRVENFPTIKTISGSELADRLFEQIVDLGVNFEFGKIVNIEKNGDVFCVITEADEFKARAVILATGVVHRKLNLPDEERLIGHGISYCALCDGAFYKGEDIALVGDGNTALQYALLLATYAKTVTIVTLFDKFFGDEALVSRVRNTENIKIIHNAKLTKLIAENEGENNKKLSALEFERTDGEKFELKTPALFVAIGQVPNNKMFSNLADLDKQGYFIANDDLSTKTQGLFVAGDCRAKQVRQLTTATADGAIAATTACNYLNLKD